MKVFLILAFIMTASCSSQKYIPERVQEISRAQSEQCLFVDDLKIIRSNISQKKLDIEIKLWTAEKNADSYVIDERIINGKKTEVIGSLFDCTH